MSSSLGGKWRVQKCPPPPKIGVWARVARGAWRRVGFEPRSLAGPEAANIMAERTASANAAPARDATGARGSRAAGGGATGRPGRTGRTR